MTEWRVDPPVPGWAAKQMSDNALWMGRWAGCSDVLARLVRRLPEDEDTIAALAGYEKLKAQFENPRMVANAKQGGGS